MASPNTYLTLSAISVNKNEILLTFNVFKDLT